MIEGDIELVCIEDIGYFFLKDDKAYARLRPKHGEVILDYEPRAFAHNLAGIQNRFRETRDMGLFGNLLTAWGGAPDIFDVGVHVGRWSLPLALFQQQAGLDSRFYLFEPGRTAALLPFTIEINQLANVELVEAIVSDYAGIGSLRFDPAELVSARAYKPDHPHISRLCRVTNLDLIRSKSRRARPALVKIDTEGHEVAVLLGAKKLIEEGQFVITLEYRDWLMNVGREVLNELFQQSHVFDLGENMVVPYIVHVDELEGHFKRVSEPRLRTGQTDLLFISKRIPNAQALIDVVQSHPKYEAPVNA